MTDTPAQKPAGSTRRTSPVLVWVLVLVAALVAFGAVVAMSGGIDGVMKMVGLGSAPSTNSTPASTSSKPGGSVVPTSSAAATDTAAPAESALPAEAQERVYTEQLLSQESITALVDKKLSTIRFGTAKVSGGSALVPVKLGFTSGQSLSATMKLRKHADLWNFYSIRAAVSDNEGPVPTEIDSSVVAVFAAQQATAANQKMLVDGVLGGGFKTAKVTSVTKGAGTATVNLQLSGGTAKPSKGGIVCISKTDGTTPYWFIVRFDPR